MILWFIIIFLKRLKRENKRKKVIDTTTGIIYDSLRLAAESMNIPKSNLSKYLVGTRTNKTTLKYL